MADAELVEYIKENLPRYGEKALREQLSKDGVDADEIETALAGAKAAAGAVIAKARHRKRLALIATAGGFILIGLAVVLSTNKPPAPEAPKDAAAEAAADIGDIGDVMGEETVFRGHYGYMLKLPPRYGTHQTFLDPRKTHERVFIFPEGTNYQHFINEGLYGPMGILRLDVTLRRVPQGLIDIDTMKAWVTGKLDADKSTYKLHDTMVQSMPAFIVNIEKPFQTTKAYVVGQKVRYEFTGGEENTVFNSILSSLYEASPHDRPGK